MCISPIRIRHPTKGYFIDVPCGKCLECFKKKVNDWAFRLNCQLMESKTAYFFTLTYDEASLPIKIVKTETGDEVSRCRQYEWYDDNITKHSSVNEMYASGELTGVHCDVIPCFMKSDVQEMVRTLRDKMRYQLRKKFTKEQTFDIMKKVKYFISSEYGGVTKRPHYHGVFFGTPFDLPQFINALNECWKYGYVSASICNERRCYYVAKYALKNAATLYHETWDRGFILVSKGLGIGFLDETTKFYMLGGDNGCYKVFIHQNGHEKLIPKYYRDKVFVHEHQKDALKEIWDNFDELANAPLSENPYIWRGKCYQDKLRKIREQQRKEKL